MVYKRLEALTKRLSQISLILNLPRLSSRLCSCCLTTLFNFNMFRPYLLSALLALARLATSKSPDLLVPRQSGPTCNTPDDRGCWTDDFSIDTDYDIDTPDGITRVIDLVITNVTSFSPEGFAKRAMLINGTFPGPTIVGDWGDTFEITVHNQLQSNGTSIHWHGLRMLNANDQDGVNGITECPIKGDGGSKTYTFRATQYGTSWYHSHYSAQYGDGVVGAIQINGPASAPYDTDLGPFAISDWYQLPAFQLERMSELTSNPLPPVSSNVLFNGTNINPDSDVDGGEYSVVSLTPGRTHRLRLINTSVENHFTISLVDHNLTVIATDFVPVEPRSVESLFLAVGQRYDVLIDADQDVGSYWFNATVRGGLCGMSANTAPAAIFRYDGATDDIPEDPGTPITTVACVDNTGFVPVVSRTAPADEFTGDEVLDVTLDTQTRGNASVFRWQINGQDIDVMWDKPTLEYVREGNTSYPDEANVVVVDDPVWTFVVIQNENVVPHPIHLHGHDFLILGTNNVNNSAGEPVVFDPDTDMDRLNFENPMRRDVAMLPSNGWLAIAWLADNPGAWLMHCHIAWHVSQGLSVQFLERRDEIPELMDLDDLEPVCDDFEAWFDDNPYRKTDSGL
ncbi:laccase [Xylariomycetidae sp. FL2044]|nr:laccase [Xylariomycetidae sp. FL2044]